MAIATEPDAQLASSTDKSGDNLPPKGKSDATPSLENLQGENKRLSGKIAKLEADLEDAGLINEELKDEIEVIKEQLSSKSTSGEKKDVVARLNELKANPKYKDEIELLAQLAEEQSEKKAKDIFFQEQLEEMEEMLEDKAKELNMEKEELRKALQPYAARYRDKFPLRRIKFSLREYLDFRSRIDTLNKKEQANKEKEEADKLLAESGGRTEREVTAHDKLKSSKGDLQKLGDALTELIG